MDVNDLPETQIVAARFIRPGDYIRRPDLTFGLVREFQPYDACTAVGIEFIDGKWWICDGVAPLFTARCREEAAAWNAQRSKLDMVELDALFAQHSHT